MPFIVFPKNNHVDLRWGHDFPTWIVEECRVAPRDLISCDTRDEAERIAAEKNAQETAAWNRYK